MRINGDESSEGIVDDEETEKTLWRWGGDWRECYTVDRLPTLGGGEGGKETTDLDYNGITVLVGSPQTLSFLVPGVV